VTIATRGREGNLARIVTTLLIDPATYELVVVVDGCDVPKPRLPDAAEHDGRLRCIQIDRGGSQGARQAGLEAATGDVVLFLDDDVMPSHGLVSAHATQHVAGEPVVVVGYMPTVVAIEGVEAFGVEHYARAYEHTCRLYEHDPESILRFLWGGNISVPRVECLNVGFVSAQYPPGVLHNDRDFGLRCLRVGLGARFDRSLMAVHAYERSLERHLDDAFRQGIGRRLIQDLHSDLLAALPPDQMGSASPVRRALGRLRLTRVIGEPCFRAGVGLTRYAQKQGWGFVAQRMTRLLFVAQLYAGTQAHLNAHDSSLPGRNVEHTRQRRISRRTNGLTHRLKRPSPQQR
jgi:glycosyltransferase involved in cell wall biosynthesis